jgi:hypothetical protein
MLWVRLRARAAEGLSQACLYADGAMTTAVASWSDELEHSRTDVLDLTAACKP